MGFAKRLICSEINTKIASATENQNYSVLKLVAHILGLNPYSQKTSSDFDIECAAKRLLQQLPALLSISMRD